MIRRTLLWLSVLLVVAVAGAAVATETWGRAWLGEQIASGLREELGLAEPPSVTVLGSPLAWELAQRRLVGIRASAATWPLKVGDVTITFREVQLDTGEIRIGAQDAVVSTLTAHGLLPSADLARLAGVPVTSAADGRLHVSYSVEVFGQALTAEASGVPRLRDQTVVIEQAQLTIVGNTLSSDMSQQLIDRLVKPISLDLDGGFTVTGIEPSAAGLQVTITGRDLPVRWR